MTRLYSVDKFRNYLSDLLLFKLLDVFHVIPGVGISENKNIDGSFSKYQVLSISNIPTEPFMPVIGEISTRELCAVSQEQIILHNDFLITNKQTIKGISAKFLMVTGLPIVPNENILILRPKITWDEEKQMFIDALLYKIVNRLDHFANSKSILNQTQKYIAIKDLAEVEIEINDMYLHRHFERFVKNYTTLIEINKTLLELKEQVKTETDSIEFKINISPTRLLHKKQRRFSSQAMQVEEIIRFDIRLGKTYYLQPMLNIGADYEQYFGEHGNMLKVYFNSYNSIPISATINRLANPNKTPRILFKGNDYNRYIQARHQIGDAIKITMDKEYPNSILIE